MNPMRHSRRFTIIGGALGLGAPLGLVLVRLATGGSTEISADPWLWTYTTFGTMIAMAAFGRTLGRGEDRLEEATLTDALTGLGNRRLFDLRLEEEVRRAARYHRPVSLLIIDLDRFKRINDQFGHLTGDRVLRTVARVVRDSFRDIDVVCRYGGEEIAVILPDTSIEEATQLAERARARVASAPLPIEGASEVLTISVGLAGSTPEREPHAYVLTALADAALYRAKREGRNRCQVSLDEPIGNELHRVRNGSVLTGRRIAVT